MQRSLVLSELRVRVTGASIHYVGSVTVHEEMCDALGLLDRQMVHIRNERTGVDLSTYVIRGLQDTTSCPPGTLCLNGAAAHLVQVGDIVSLTARGLVPYTNTTASASTMQSRRWDAVQDGVTNVISRMGGRPEKSWANEAVLEYACGKVHRPRITHVLQSTTAGNNTTTDNSNNTIDNNNNQHPIFCSSALPALLLDQDWAEQGSILEGEAIHLVNVTNGQRDIVTVQYARVGSQQCAIQNIDSKNNSNTPNRPGYQVGDVVIAMNYGYIARGTILEGKAPPMQICFPFERPVCITPMPTTTTTATAATKTPVIAPAIATSILLSSTPLPPTMPKKNDKDEKDEHENNVDLHALWDHSTKQHHQQQQQKELQQHSDKEQPHGVTV